MEIIKVKPHQIDIVMSLIRQAIQQMEKEGIYQWDDIYPNKDIVSADVEAGNLYSAVENSVLGIVALNESQLTEYQSISWADSGRPLIVHRLCIAPAFQGKGVAKQLMQFAESYGRENGYSSIRLDAFIQNNKAVGLYDYLNYERRGAVQFRKGGFYCYEKALLS